MKSTEFLQAAIDVQAERGKQYDKPSGERSMAATVSAFNAITGRDLSEAEGWLLLQTLKDVRQWQNPSKYHHDSALDGVAYSALKAEALSEEKSVENQSAEYTNILEVPSWEDAPDWAQWLAVDNDHSHWFRIEPFWLGDISQWAVGLDSRPGQTVLKKGSGKPGTMAIYARPTSTAK